MCFKWKSEQMIQRKNCWVRKKICFSQIRQTTETRRGKTVPLTDTLFGSHLYLDKPPSYVTTSLVLISHIIPRHRLIRLGLSFRSFSRMSGFFFPEVFGTSSLSCHTWYLLHVFPLQETVILFPCAWLSLMPSLDVIWFFSRAWREFCLIWTSLDCFPAPGVAFWPVCTLFDCFPVLDLRFYPNGLTFFCLPKQLLCCRLN